MFLRFWRKNVFFFCDFGGKMHFPVLAEICTFAILARICVLVGRYVLRFLQKNAFLWFCGGECIFAVLAENMFLRFWHDNVFMVLVENMFLRFCPFSWVTKNGIKFRLIVLELYHVYNRHYNILIEPSSSKWFNLVQLVGFKN